MEMGKRKLLLNWCDAHSDLKRIIENDNAEAGVEIENGRGWTYLTFFPKGIEIKDMLYDIDRIQRMAKENGYYLPRDVVVQHNKVVLTAYPDHEAPGSPLAGLYFLLMSYATHFYDARRYPAHGFFGKLGGIYERPEKGRVLALYSKNEDALLDIYESLEKLIRETQMKGLQFDVRFSNGLSAIPRMLHGFDDPEYRRAGVQYYRISDPEQFAILLEQARRDYDRYRLAEMFTPIEIR